MIASDQAMLGTARANREKCADREFRIWLEANQPFDKKAAFQAGWEAAIRSVHQHMKKEYEHRQPWKGHK